METERKNTKDTKDTKISGFLLTAVWGVGAKNEAKQKNKN